MSFKSDVNHFSASRGELERRLLLRPALSTPTPALFLDRDGVVIEDKHHLHDPDKVELCRGVTELLSHAQQAGWPVVLITNQSGIARGYFGWEAYDAVTQRLLSLLGDDAPLSGIYANGHGPDAPASSWRKPSPAMLQAAAADLKLDLRRSLLVGDRLSDLQAGTRAGLRWVGHVSSGHGEQERSQVLAWHQRKHSSNRETHDVELALLKTLQDFPLERMAPMA